MTQERKWGWKPDLPDKRDYICNLKAVPGVAKNKIDLRTTGWLPPVWDQGDTSTCTAQVVAAAVSYARKAQSLQDWTPSRLFIYYNERLLENTINQPEAGAELRNGIKSATKDGIAPENLWAWDLTKITHKPSEAAYVQAKKGVIKQYSRVPIKLANIQNVLTHKIPIMFGATIYESFMSGQVAATGVVPMPKNTERPLGGHAMLMVGSTETHFIVRNSWGGKWGEEGYCFIPHEYLTDTNLADDFWAIFLA